MEIPLPSDKRFHSVFVCPVSKEQATDTNPPLMLSCGHVINTESFQRLVKGGYIQSLSPLPLQRYISMPVMDHGFRSHTRVKSS